MSELRELYQQLILDHNKSPRNFGDLPDANRSSEGHNPLCGDHIKVAVKLSEDLIEEIAFLGSGCAISKASASMMTAEVKGKTIEEVETIFRDFQSMVTSDITTQPETDHMGKLAVFSGVREFPARIKCATLSWHTLHAALGGDDQSVTTE